MLVWDYIISNWNCHKYYTLYYVSAQIAAFDAYAANDGNPSMIVLD